MADYPPKLNLKRYVDGDIYGFSALTNNDPNSRDEVAQFGFWGEYDEPGNTGGKNSVPWKGKLVACGAIGKSGFGNIPQLTSPFDVMDTGGGEVKQPTINKYQWWNPNISGGGAVVGSNQQTFSAAYHDIHYINPAGKLRTFSTSYSRKGAIHKMFFNLGPRLQFGCDHRIFELWQEDPNGYGYNPDLVLKHICCAADECIMTLDTNGTIRIVQSGTSGVNINETMGPDEEWKVVYFDKEDLEDHFWIDETGTPVELENVDFVDCWCSGGGTPAQGICVWALKKDGTLYFQSMHAMVWHDVLFGNEKDVAEGYPDWPPEQKKVLQNSDIGKFRSEPYRIKPGPSYCIINDCSGMVPETILNPYHGAALKKTNESIVCEFQNYDLNGYYGKVPGSDTGTRNIRNGSGGIGHVKGIEKYFGFTVPTTDECIYGKDSMKRGWNYEAGRNALNQIPKNPEGKRYKVISLCDGYGHGGACLCVDPDKSVGDYYFIGHPNQEVEPVLLISWSPDLHRHMYRQIHKIKKVRVIKQGTEWRTIPNIYGNVIDGVFVFDQELFDLLYLNKETGAYIPPRNFSTTRLNMCLNTNVGMVASFQGKDMKRSQSGVPSAGYPPLLNYEYRGSTGILVPILNKNGSGEQTGNWFYNYDWGPKHNPPFGELDREGGFTDEPIEYDDTTIEGQAGAAQKAGALNRWWTCRSDDGVNNNPINRIDQGPHVIDQENVGGDDAMAESGGRFGFGHMPSPGQGQGNPGIRNTVSYNLDLLGFPSNTNTGEKAKAISYFAWTKEVGYDYEENYWNQDSLVYMWTGIDNEGNSLRDEPDIYQKGSSIIMVWHVGEGSPYPPFSDNPVVWWSAQGDNLNVIFDNGVIDSASYYESEVSAMILPPLTLPVRTATIGPAKPPTFGEAESPDGGGFGDGGFGGGGAGGGGQGGGGNPFRLFLVDDPDPSLENEARGLILQDTEEEPGSTEGGGIDPETPDCKRGGGTVITPGDDDDDTIPQPKLGEIVPDESINNPTSNSSGAGTPLQGG